MSDLEKISREQGFFSKMKKDPVPAIGMGGFFGVVAYAIYNYRRKAADTKPSVYVIQTRVAAQGLVIGVLTLGLGFHMYQNYIQKYSGQEVENALNVSHHHQHAQSEHHPTDDHKKQHLTKH